MIKERLLVIFWLLFFVSLVSADSIGYLVYIPGYEYEVFVDSGSDSVFFARNSSFYQDTYSAPYGIFNEFTKRINYVWFGGYFNQTDMHINQYVGMGVFHSNVTEPLVVIKNNNGAYYQGTVITGDKPVFLPSEYEIGVLFDTENNYVELDFQGVIFDGFIDPDWNLGAVFMGPFLIQIGLTNSTGQLGFELQEWLLINPSWDISLYPV